MAISIKPVAAWIRGKFNKTGGHNHAPATAQIQDAEQASNANPPVCAGST
ncbi:MAG: hypothetical protein JRH03_11145 [Deltaproteobacteria bacterium]|nr:hypothetical protein [Deltaproteobacteria bacterium]